MSTAELRMVVHPEPIRMRASSLFADDGRCDDILESSLRLMSPRKAAHRHPGQCADVRPTTGTFEKRKEQKKLTLRPPASTRSMPTRPLEWCFAASTRGRTSPSRRRGCRATTTTFCFPRGPMRCASWSGCRTSTLRASWACARSAATGLWCKVRKSGKSFCFC
jgi:hypothetical protein